ncbi:hypothetical protein MKZ08_13670 [Viridibacillus sp. FSL R5-0477]|uniref:hypothetical protein n=1 Tax=Viridibacillus TaxID=496496 RepID=UPI0004BC086F|nr:hypothetical protein [Viridibacillus arenosi]
MEIVEIFNKINRLSVVDKERLLSRFNYFLFPLQDTRLVFQEVIWKSEIMVFERNNY